MIFVYLGYFILLLNFFLYWRGFSKYGKTFQYLVYYLTILVIAQVSMEILVLQSIDNLYFVHVYFIGQFLCLGFFYKSLMKTKTQVAIIQYSMLAGCVILIVDYTINPEQFFKFNLLEIALTSLLVVLYAVMHLYNMLLEKKQYYYLTIGIITYLLASTVLFFVGNLTIGLSDAVKFLTWTLNSFLIILFQLLILVEWKKSFYKKAIKN
ncbi:hypothetical protein IQ02_00017 [Flavobacterium glaciei]|uniref:YhhN-like protein n=2 Tax=Flavobacterium glaciei TaxID=386300 RepID=A0A562Q6S5_9FLAO|nr:hypothetical protein DFR66_10117 [Flavobacterium glaciei]TWI51890.1 hypothetical protein IQ02_00017 [Flavobacterium glaciei]